MANWKRFYVDKSQIQFLNDKSCIITMSDFSFYYLRRFMKINENDVTINYTEDFLVLLPKSRKRVSMLEIITDHVLKITNK